MRRMGMAEAKHIFCGACGADQFRTLGIPCISERTQAVAPRWEAMRIVQCMQCEFYYTDPIPFWGSEDLQTLSDVGYFRWLP